MLRNKICKPVVSLCAIHRFSSSLDVIIIIRGRGFNCFNPRPGPPASSTTPASAPACGRRGVAQLVGTRVPFEVGWNP